ncbi:nucleoside triphosphate pyrophosphohydrolase [Exiguobacterium sp. UBA3968]|uniref:nucleoside triphosphate pyrophosphohydrolase n=1 Tax=Exiguobacterium sp. UBA3968 TaxID=1946492 RepID=UPI0025BE1C3E|nr:nucleoside triphosphate pyrophosphohydrolase [Exiguobacterium sp. UBA3968]
MPLYHKLVRDAIPNIIDQNGKKATFQTLDEHKFLVEAKKKLHEELAEYEEATTDADAVEELADLLELIQALAKTHGVTVEELEAVRQKKQQQRGGFEERLYLIEVED